MKFCDTAIDVSLKSTSRMQHGAIIIRGNNVVGIGWNKESTHAEANAILQCLQQVLQKPKV